MVRNDLYDSFLKWCEDICEVKLDRSGVPTSFGEEYLKLYAWQIFKQAMEDTSTNVTPQSNLYTSLAILVEGGYQKLLYDIFHMECTDEIDLQSGGSLFKFVYDIKNYKTYL